MKPQHTSGCAGNSAGVQLLPMLVVGAEVAKGAKDAAVIVETVVG